MVIKYTNYENKKCPFCNKETTTTSAYTLHLKSCHNNPESNWFKVNRVQKICLKCGKQFVSETKEQKYCSRACANSHEQTKEQNETRRQKLQKRQLYYCELCGKQISYGSKLCITCFNKNRPPYSEEARQKQREKMKNKPRWHIKRNQASFAENFFINVLSNNSIPFEREYAVKKEDGIHCYFLDFFIKKGSKKIDLEIDGSQHSFRKEHDKKRDAFLIKEGYEIYRISWNELKSQKGKELMKEKIDKFICYYNA